MPSDSDTYDFKKALDEVLSSGGASDAKKEEIFSALGKAIMLDLCARLFDRLSLEKQKEAIEKHILETELGIKFFLENIGEEELKKSFSEASGNVIQEFIEKL
ncbi:MAG: hypothetical protein HY470_00090 [Candidatus Ryanbacteria bacterium]|nr:hypothetical protein [Candidatus Ryanbacteria bacterium]